MNMIEKVARAIDNAHKIGNPFKNDKMLSEARAKAAIEAMKEPTEEMILAGHLNKNLSIEGYKLAYRNMIEAALKE